MAGKNPSKSPVAIALVEDDVPYRGYVAALLGGTGAWRVVLEAGSVEEALRLGQKQRPRVLLLDIALPDRSGAAAVGQFLKLWPDVSVVMLTALDGDESILASIHEGAAGYLLKGTPSDDVLAALDDVLAGGAPMSPSIARRVLALMRTLPPENPRQPPPAPLPLLTPREHEVVSLVAEGLGDKEIADRLKTAVSTVKNHLASVYAKWRVRSRTEAAVKFAKAERKS